MNGALPQFIGLCSKATQQKKSQDNREREGINRQTRGTTYCRIRNYYLSNSKTFQDGNGNGNFEEINSNDFQDGNWEVTVMVIKWVHPNFKTVTVTAISLIFFSFCLFGFPCDLSFQGLLLSFWAFSPSFPRILWVRQEKQILVFFGSFPCLFLKRQGKDDQS